MDMFPYFFFFLLLLDIRDIYINNESTNILQNHFLLHLFPTHRAITLWTVLEKMGLKVLTSGGNYPWLKLLSKRSHLGSPGSQGGFHVLSQASMRKQWFSLIIWWYYIRLVSPFVLRFYI